MKQVHNNVLISSMTACVLLTAQPVFAQTTQITAVTVNPIDGGISVILQTSSGDQPQILTTKRDKALVANIINTQLLLPQGKSFRQDNPSPGIASVEVNQLDANSVSVTVMGIDNSPASKPIIRENNSLSFVFTTTEEATAAAPNTSIPNTSNTSTPNTSNTSNTSTPNTSNTSNTPNTPNTSNTTVSVPPTSPGDTVEFTNKPDVLVPNPEITIDGKPAQPAKPNQPYNVARRNVAPPFVPTAVPPLVGDIAVSNIDISPTVIDLGTQERVPRLVLRDAPVREVLSLLARAAGINLVYVGGEGTGSTAGQTTSQNAPSEDSGDKKNRIYEKISLDIENETVQDVFNYVLRLSGLEANRSGRTIFVGARLPNSARDTVMRSLRLNQVTVGVALNFLVALGAESAVSRERQVTSVETVPVGEGVAPITKSTTTTETKIQTQRIDYKDSDPMLKGLQALGDDRTNSITLIGSSKLVDMAVSQLTKLDIRRRQVVINIKIIDVNLREDQPYYNTSFAFGVGNNYFSVDDGAARLNFGASQPPSRDQSRDSLTDTPVIRNPITGANFFRDKDNTLAGNSDSTRPVNTNPRSLANSLTNSLALPNLYNFPKRFLASLRSEVTRGNAKILTDPTLIVQEGQTANLQLTQQVVGNITNQVTRGDGSSIQTVKAEKETVGLTLSVKVDRIDDNGFISLSVAPVIKAPQATEKINVGTGSQRIFLVSERSLNSGLIRLRDGQTLILSGIIQDQDRTTVSKIPILGDIPLLGSLFRSTNRENERREVIVLLTPQIMDDSESSSYGQNYNPSPQVREMLDRRGLRVPGSR